MKKMARVSIYFLTLCIVLPCVSFAMASKKPTNEIPMYGGIPRTPHEKEADDKLIQSTIKAYGSKEAAFQKAFEFGWSYFYKRDYATAMKRFNQSWLIDPDDPRVFNAFGAVVEAQGDSKEAVSWYLKGADKGDPKAQFNLGNAYFNGNGAKRNYVEAAKWFHLAADQNLEWAQNMIGVCYVDRTPSAGRG
ncbi:MAG: tetratricopeptide repeat protein [Candidatus Omnitrophica bacterium]|nr:tetratricopeptide repeat protein [Candidatus Omnitrophota bacterium]